MAQTVVGLFDTSSEAQNAIQDLTNAGFSRENIDLSAATAADMANSNANTSNNVNTSNTTAEAVTDTAGNVGDSVSNFFSSLFGNDDDARSYSEVARSGASVVTVHVQTAEEAARAADILDRYNAVDVNDRYAQYNTAAATTTDANYVATDANYAATSDTNYAATTDVDVNRAAATTGDMVIPVVEESIAVGKRAVEGGGARIRSRIIERPVEESIRLREERIVVDRRPVNRAATEADFAGVREGDITLTEHSEQAVVSKEARVVEEVTVGKDVTERTETISDTVRSTDVDVEQLNTTVDTAVDTTIDRVDTDVNRATN